jgi:predicted Zn-dependent protease
MSDLSQPRYVARFSDGKSAESRDVLVTLSDRGVMIERPGEPDPLIWPFGALSSAEPLSSYSIDALLAYSYQPGASLFVADTAFARRLAEAAPHLTARAQRLRVAKPWFYAASVTALVAAGIWMAGLSPSRAIARMLPDSAREALGDQVLASMTKNRATCTAPAGVAALDALTDKLSKAAGGTTRFKVVVVDWELLNAFATPGERIVLTRGLIEKAKSPDEVAGVLAHEMGHGLEMHPETGIVRSIGLAAGAELLLGGSGGGLANIGLLLTQLSYSRDAEREADEQALQLLKIAGVSPQGLIDFFDRVLEIENKEGGGGPGVLRSHPQTQERRSRVAAAQTYATVPALDADAWAALKSVCTATSESEEKPRPQTAPPRPTPQRPGETDI